MRRLSCSTKLCVALVLASLTRQTASVDFATDAKIQMTIASEFQGKTLITIAHRCVARAAIDLTTAASSRSSPTTVSSSWTPATSPSSTVRPRTIAAS